MNYLSYVVGAYAVFVVVLLWDFIAPRMQSAANCAPPACAPRVKPAPPRPRRWS